MPEYRRVYVPGGTYFFTVVTEGRCPFLTEPLARQCLHSAFAETRQWRPFDTQAFCLMPDHLHCLWTLPEEDVDYSSRWIKIKAAFTRSWLAAGGSELVRSPSKRKKNEHAIWQRREWEHKIRSQEDFNRHVDYIHFNPVKHGLAVRPADWEWSTFQRYVDLGFYELGWGDQEPPNIRKLNGGE